MAIGGLNDSNGAGAVWIFNRNGPVWTQYGNKLMGTMAVGNAFQGCAISLSADGNTLAVGGQHDNNHIGATWMWILPPPPPPIPPPPRMISGSPPADNAFRHIYVGRVTGRPPSDAHFRFVDIGINNWRGNVGKDGGWNHLN